LLYQSLLAEKVLVILAKSQKNLDFDIIQENLDTAFKNSETYSMYNSCDIEYDSDGNDLNIIVAVNDSIDPSLSVDYAKYAISTINYEAQRQVEGLKDYSNSDNYYGGLFDDVDAFITVAPVIAIWFFGHARILVDQRIWYEKLCGERVGFVFFFELRK